MLEDLCYRVTPKIIFVPLVILFGFANQVYALGITGTKSYSHALEAGGIFEGQGALFTSERAFKSFDPALGALTDVEIRIFGDIIYSGFGGANWQEDAFGTPLPLPYRLETEYQLDISGLFGNFFSLDTPIIIKDFFDIPGSVDTFPISRVSSFSFNFDYDEAINQIFWGPEDVSCAGCFDFSPPLGMSGQPEGFIDDGTLLDQLDFNHSLAFMSLGQFRPSFSSLTVISDITIQYTYKFTELEPSPVPVPAGLWLFATAMAGLLGFKRRYEAAKSRLN